MRIDVVERGYADAVLSLVNGNLLAARTATGLADRLHAFGGMAGDDDTAAAFAASYDEAAAASVAALQSVVGAFGTLARLVEASLTNHAHAEARAVLPGWGRAVTGPPTAADNAVGVLLAEPPSSTGSGSSGPGGALGVVLDVLHDVFWPTADTDRLHSAAHAWATAAEALDLLTARCDSAVAALEESRSPEVPLATGVLADLRDEIGDLSAQLTALGRACGDYADHVDAKRHELLHLLKELAYELGVTAAAAGVLSFVTAGGAAGAAGSLGAARVAAASGRARGILESLRLLAAGPTLETRTVAVTAGDVGTFSERINGARVMVMEDVPTTNRALTQRPGWLGRHQHSGSHTLTEHVGQSMDDLAAQIARGKHQASTFQDVETAEGTLSNLIEAHQGSVRAWLGGTDRRLRLDGDMGYPTGVTMDGLGHVTQVTGVRAILVRDPAMPDGWRILTGFPQA